jgi:peptidyl-prolyl cis-trans isomerase C
MATPLFADVIVNGETITKAAIAAEAQNHPAPPGKPGLAWRGAARALALRTLLLQEARRQRLTPQPAEVGPGRYETDEEALIRALLEIAVTVDPPSAAAVQAEWARDPARFRAPPLWEASHILVACDGDDAAAQAAARERARDLTRKALARPADFARLAAMASDCGSKASGGALGQLGPGDTVPEFEAALRGLADGEITAAPVPTRFGWHVIRLDASAEGRTLPFEMVRTKIEAAMEKSAWAAAARNFLAGLAAKAEIAGCDLGRASDSAT